MDTNSKRELITAAIPAEHPTTEVSAYETAGGSFLSDDQERRAVSRWQGQQHPRLN